MKFLIIDDQRKKYLDLYEFVESLSGLHVIDWAKDFHQAKLYLRDDHFDIVFLDMSFDVHRSAKEESNFAGLAGLHVLQFIRRAHIETEVIVCTSHTRYSDPDFGLIDGIEALRTHVLEFFGNVCRGCVYMGADIDQWKLELRELVDNGAA